MSSRNFATKSVITKSRRSAEITSSSRMTGRTLPRNGYWVSFYKDVMSPNFLWSIHILWYLPLVSVSPKVRGWRGRQTSTWGCENETLVRAGHGAETYPPIPIGLLGVLCSSVPAAVNTDCFIARDCVTAQLVQHCLRRQSPAYCAIRPVYYDPSPGHCKTSPDYCAPSPSY
jgi:hypothetical protein